MKIIRLEIGSSFISSNLEGKLNVLLEECLSLGVNCAQIGVLEHVDEVRLHSLVNSVSCSGSESEVRVEGSDLVSDSSDERSLLSESLILVLLVLLDLSDRHCAWSVSVGLLVASSSLCIACFAFHALELGA